jgi:hypothetical protein
MSVDINVLFRSETDLETTVRELGELLHVQFTRITEDDLLRYEFVGPGFVLVVFGDHGFESEISGHKLSEYEVVVDCTATDPELDYDAAERIRTGIGMFVYRKLIAKGARAIMLRDLQRLIEPTDMA